MKSLKAESVKVGLCNIKIQGDTLIIPLCIPIIILPNIPPPIDLNSKALLKILINTLGIFSILKNIIPKHTNKYNKVIIGTILDAKLAILLAPPTIIIITNIAITIPII